MLEAQRLEGSNARKLESLKLEGLKVEGSNAFSHQTFRPLSFPAFLLSRFPAFLPYCFLAFQADSSRDLNSL
jgi:hypothetical protein